LAEELGVHFGFREYLYNEEKLAKALLGLRPNRKTDNEERIAKAPSPPVLETDETTNKLEQLEQQTSPRPKCQIILEKIRELFKDHPDYRLFIAGHSLGGALTTLMALEAGADENIPKPVTAITSGAPKVGNLEFLKAFEELEKQNKLRCLQVTNDRDAVPLSPPDTYNPFFAMFCRFTA
jgi:hypothetical protein